MPAGSAYGPSYYGEIGATADAVHTMTVNVDPTTLGESILSGSGHDYSTLATPEPSSALLLSSGVGVLASLGRRRWPCHTRAEGRASLRPSGRGGLDVPI